jgi:hypothetical protein
MTAKYSSTLKHSRAESLKLEALSSMPEARTLKPKAWSLEPRAYFAILPETRLV